MLSPSFDRLPSRVTALLAALALFLCSYTNASAQDQFDFKFSATTALAGLPGSVTFDSNGDFWVAGQEFGGAIVKMVDNGSGFFSRQRKVGADDWFEFMRSSDVPAAEWEPLWAGANFAIPRAFLLNPKPITINVPTGTGGFTDITYQPGELAFVTDNNGTLTEQFPSVIPRYDLTSRLYRYDLRRIGDTTNQVPDYGTAFLPDGTIYGSVGTVEWNDVFTKVVTEGDIRTAAGAASGASVMDGSIAWSSDGQSIYSVVRGPQSGGIYKIDATQTNSIQRLWTDVNQTRDANNQVIADTLTGEPAVIHTSKRDLNPLSSAVGDQIVVEGSADGGNNGGVNVYLDDGTGPITAPSVLFTEAEFRSFADFIGNSFTEYTSLTFDDAGNLYFSEQQTRGVYRYDTQGRFSKVTSEWELNEFQTTNGATRSNDIVQNLQARESMEPGFAVTELIYRDDALDAPVGIFAYQPGDFDRDNDVDNDDLDLFAAALGTRWEPASEANQKFDLNGNPELFFFVDDDLSDGDDSEYRHVSNGLSTVDWRDVKILQQFANIPDGDANFDGNLDFADLDIMEANYFTVAGQISETWIDGDFASIDPDYAIDAVDANLVNLVDLEVIAEAWVNGLGQDAVTEAQAMSQGYSGQFLTDLLLAFDIDAGLDGDYNADGVVDAADYTVWRATQGDTGSGLAADGSGNGVVDEADFIVWRSNYGSGVTSVELPGDFNLDGVVDAADYTTWRAGLGTIYSETDYKTWRAAYGQTTGSASTAAAVPEPTAAYLAMLALAAATHLRRRSLL